MSAASLNTGTEDLLLSDAVVSALKQESAFRFFPELLQDILRSAQVRRLKADSEIVSENEEGAFIFMSLDQKLERFMRIGNFNDRIYVSDIEAFEFIGFHEVLEKRKFLMSYNTQDDTNVLYLSAHDLRYHFSDSAALRRFRLLNSSKAIRKFFFYLESQDVPHETLFRLLDHIQSSPRMIEKRCRVEHTAPQITFIQSGAIAGSQSDQMGSHDFVISEGSWFGAGLTSNPASRNLRLETMDTVFFHSISLTVLEQHLSPEVLQALESEPCLAQQSASDATGAFKAAVGVSAKSMVITRLRNFGFKGDSSRFRYGEFPLSPYHSTLWNFLVLFGLNLNESYISKVSDVQGPISLSQFASSLEDAGLMTNLRRYYHQGPEAVPSNSLVYFYGRPVIYIALKMGCVFLLDPVYGLVAVQAKYFFTHWNRNLVEVKKPALKEVLRDDIKVGLDKPENVGRKLLDHFLSKSSDEFRNLLTFKFFQGIVCLVVPTFLFGLINQSVGKTSADTVYSYLVGLALFLFFQAIAIYSLNVYSSEILAEVKTKAMSYFYKLYLNSLSSPTMPLRSGLVQTRMALLDYAFAALKFQRTDFILHSVMMVIFLLIIGTLSWQASFVIFSTTAAAMTLIYVLRKRGGFTEVNTAILRQDMMDGFVDTVNGIRSIRITNTMRTAEKKLTETVRQLMVGVAEYSAGMISLNQKGLLIFKIGEILGLYIVCNEFLNHRTTAADLFGLTLYFSYLTSPFMGLCSYFTNFNTVGLYAVPGQLAMSQGAQKAKNVKTTKLHGGIQFDRVSFRYNERAPWSVVECSFKINPGERIAIVGRSGSGKSTLARLIARQVEPMGGKVIYDGTDSRLLDAASVQSQVGFVPQVPTMFAGSLLANVAYGEDSSQLTKVKEICRSTHIHRFFRNLPGDYFYMLNEFGTGLSAGQKQMMALTRVLYSDPEILVLDEVTANLDPQAEGFITERVFERKRHRTTVMVVQKISAARRADRILVMKNGRIIEDGDHNRLISLAGEYAELYRHQVSDEL